MFVCARACMHASVCVVLVSACVCIGAGVYVYVCVGRSQQANVLAHHFNGEQMSGEHLYALRTLAYDSVFLSNCPIHSVCGSLSLSLSRHCHTL